MSGDKRTLQSLAGAVLVALPWLLSGSSIIGIPVEQRLAGAIACVGLLALGLSVRACLWGWCAAAVLSSLAALVQYFGWSAPLAPWVSASSVGEAFANLRQRNQFATLTSIGLLATLVVSTTVQRKVVVAATLGVLVLLALGNAASGSRTGLLQWVLVMAAMAVWPSAHRRRRLQYAAVALGAYLLACVALPWLLETVTGVSGAGLFGRLQEDPQSCQSRIVLWSNVLQLIAQKPWFGWGWGELAWAHFVHLYSEPRFCSILSNAHNLPLQIAVELGVPIAVAGCLLLLWWVLRNRPWREPDPRRQLAWGVLLVIGVHSLLEYPLWYAPFQVSVVLSLVLLCATRVAPALGRRTVGHGVTRALVTGVLRYRMRVCLVLAIGIGGACWDYWQIRQIYLPLNLRAATYRDDTLQKLQGTWLFRDQLNFAELGTTPLTPGNAPAMRQLALQLLHFTPEPMVVEVLLDSALLLGQTEELMFYRERLRRAFPHDYAQWQARNANQISVD